MNTFIKITLLLMLLVAATYLFFNLDISSKPAITEHTIKYKFIITSEGDTSYYLKLDVDISDDIQAKLVPKVVYDNINVGDTVDVVRNSFFKSLAN